MIQETITIASQHEHYWVDITHQVARVAGRAPGASGIAHIFSPHTTAGVCIQENADPPLRDDINRAFTTLFLKKNGWGHCEDNASSHMKTVVTGSGLHVPCADGRLLLVQWQAIYLCEYDGPRKGQVIVTVMV